MPVKGPRTKSDILLEKGHPLFIIDVLDRTMKPSGKSDVLPNLMVD